MADRTIGELPGVTSLDSDSLFVAQQQGVASKVTGAQLTQFANVETAAQVAAAQAAAQGAAASETAAETAKNGAETAQTAIENMTVEAETLAAGAQATVQKIVTSGQPIKLLFGLPTGPTGPAGGVNTFNNRTGAVMPAAGDYTAAMVGAAQAWDSTKLLGNTPAKSLSSPGWYRICTKTGDSGAGLFHISHSYSSGGPSDLLVYANFAQYGTELSVISSGYYRNVFPIDDLRMTKVDTSNTYHLDIHYAISGTNVVGLDAWVTSAYDNFSPKITLQSMAPVDDAPAGETVLITAEWISPPMSIGVEYRTVERWNGSPVYVQCVNCGQMADGAEVEHGIENINYVIRYEGMRSGVAMPQIYNHSLTDDWTNYIAYVNRTKICLAAGTSAVGGNTNVTIWYTKTGE